MTDLSFLADELGVSDRTLRRAAARGTVRCVRRGHRLELPVQEALYLRRRWPLLQTLVGELRTIANVRLAVLFGSTARGDDDGRSDVDLLVGLAKRGLGARALVLDRLEHATGRRVHIAEAEGANPTLLADVLRDGRVLVDRDEDWSRLVAKKQIVLAQAEADRAALDLEVWRALDELLAGTP
jgi:predicted nucleotidyltransferase